MREEICKEDWLCLVQKAGKPVSTNSEVYQRVGIGSGLARFGGFCQSVQSIWLYGRLLCELVDGNHG